MAGDASITYRKGGYRLKQVDIEYFKSYGVVTIGPFADFTCVLGPNGTGKSNFLAAVNFATGADINTLRHTDRSLINENGGSNFTKVALFMEKSDDGITVVEEKKFSRVLKADGSGEFLINNVQVRKRDYISQLEELGILKKMVSGVVKQGAVEHLAMMSGKELATLIEAVSGSASLKPAYDDCVKRVDHLQKIVKAANAEKNKAATILREYNRQKTLEKGKQQIDEDLEKVSRVHAKMQLWKVDQELAKLKELSEAAKAEYDRILSGENELIQSRVRPPTPDEETKKELDELLILVATKEKFLKLKEQALKDASAEVENAVHSLQPTSRCYDEAHEKLTDLERELLTNTSMLNTVRQNLAGLNLPDSPENVEELLKEEMIVAYWKLKIQFETETKDVRTKLEQCQDSYRSANRELKASTQIEAWKSLQVKLRQEEVTACTAEIETLQNKEGALKERLKILEVEVEESSFHANLIQGLEKELKQIRTQIMIRHLQESSKKDLALRELQETFGEAVIGRVQDLWEPVSERYRLAANRILGPRREAIVVDKPETAYSCIHLLETRKLTYEVFLPIQSMQDIPLKDTYRASRHLNGVSLLYDRLRFDAKIEKVMRFLLRNTLVCDNYETARYHAWEVDVDQREDAVEALHGILFKADGSVIVGNLPNHCGSNSLETLNSRCADVVQQLSEATQKSSNLTAKKEELANVKDCMHRNHLETKRVTRAQTEAIEKLQQLRPELIAAETNRLKALADFRKWNHILEDTEKYLSEKEKSVFQNFVATYGSDNVREFDIGNLHETNSKDRSREKLQEQETLQEVKVKNLQAACEEAKTGFWRWCAFLAEAKQDIEILRLRESSLKKEVTVIRKEFEVILERKNELQAFMNESIEDIDSDLQHVRSLLTESRAKIGEYHQRIQKKNEVKKKLLWKCWSEGIVVGTKRGDEESQHSFDLDDIENDSVDIDFSELGDDFKTTRIMWDVSIKKCAESIKDLKQKQKLSGSTNVDKNPTKHSKTIEAAKKASLKAAQVAKEFREANNAMKLALEERKTKFLSCFNKIKDATEVIYRRLYAGKTAEAVLYAVDEECPFLGPINYDCVCPGKRLQKMRMLSGGEKTIAALALLFGILSFKPPPFAIFDEIDAALDKEKLEMLGKFLSGCTESSINETDVGEILLPYPCIAITHQKDLMKHAQNIIGVTRDVLCIDPEADPLSAVFAINLSDYQSDPA